MFRSFDSGRLRSLKTQQQKRALNKYRFNMAKINSNNAHEFKVENFQKLSYFDRKFYLITFSNFDSDHSNYGINSCDFTFCTHTIPINYDRLPIFTFVTDILPQSDSTVASVRCAMETGTFDHVSFFHQPHNISCKHAPAQT